MMRDYYAYEPKQMLHYLARRTWNKPPTLPPKLQAIKDALLAGAVAAALRPS